MINKKDVSIELFRILACFFVICIHINQGYYYDGIFSRNALMVACIRADAVAMFWFITGSFYFKATSYRKVIYHTIRRILIPMLSLIIFCQLFNGFLFQNMTISESFHTFTIVRALEILNSVFLKWHTPIRYTGYLWYLFAYFIVILLFPVEKVFVDSLSDKKRIKSYLLISFCILLLNDIAQNQFANFSHHTFGAAIPAIIIMIWGHFVYIKKEQLSLKVPGILWLLLFLVINICRCWIQTNIYLNVQNPQDSILYWYSSFGLLATISMYMFIYYIDQKSKVKWIKSIVIFIGSFTFNIYLIHGLIRELFVKYQIINNFRKMLQVDGTLYKQILFYVCMGGSLFFSSLIVNILIRLMGNGLKRLLSIKKA